MARLGVILMVVGGLMFFSFFLTVASGGAASVGAVDEPSPRERMEQRSRAASTAFGISAVGMLLGIVGATLVAVGRGQPVASGDDEGPRFRRRWRMDRSEDGPMVVCHHCGSRRLARDRTCGNCGIPT